VAGGAGGGVVTFQKRKPKHPDLQIFLTVDEKAELVKLDREISTSDKRRRELTTARRAIMNRALQRKLDRVVRA
jgi:hypothetical protein